MEGRGAGAAGVEAGAGAGAGASSSFPLAAAACAKRIESTCLMSSRWMMSSLSLRSTLSAQAVELRLRGLEPDPAVASHFAEDVVEDGLVGQDDQRRLDARPIERAGSGVVVALDQDVSRQRARLDRVLGGEREGGVAAEDDHAAARSVHLELGRGHVDPAGALAFGIGIEPLEPVLLRELAFGTGDLDPPARGHVSDRALDSRRAAELLVLDLLRAEGGRAGESLEVERLFHAGGCAGLVEVRDDDEQQPGDDGAADGERQRLPGVLPHRRR